jgi:hypothetical protein
MARVPRPAAPRQATQKLLMLFDVALPLDETGLDATWLPYGLGWRAGLAGASARVAAKHRPTPPELLPSDLPDLLAANRHDEALYRFARSMAQLDGLMYDTVSAAGLVPYPGYESLPEPTASVALTAGGGGGGEGAARERDPAREALARRVGCGYLSKRRQLLGAMGEDVAQLVAVHKQPMRRIPALDEGRSYGAREGGGGEEAEADEDQEPGAGGGSGGGAGTHDGVGPE